MPYNWEVFPARPWPRDFGYRERRRPIVVIDPNQLELSHQFLLPERRPPPPLLEQLRATIVASDLTMVEFANWVMGCSDVTLYRYLRGSKIPEDRRNFLTRLESARLTGDQIVIAVRCGPLANGRRWPRRRFNWQRMEWEYGRTGWL